MTGLGTVPSPEGFGHLAGPRRGIGRGAKLGDGRGAGGARPRNFSDAGRGDSPDRNDGQRTGAFYRAPQTPDAVRRGKRRGALRAGREDGTEPDVVDPRA